MIEYTNIAATILETFDKSAVEVFRRWFAQHPHVNKWMIGADFALRDKNRPGDCFAFSILPYDALPQDIEADIKANLPRDLKERKTLEPAARIWLRSERRFHIVIPMNRDRLFYTNGPGTKPVEIARESLRVTLEAVKQAERGKDQIKLTAAAYNKSKANAFNVGLFTDLTLLSLYLALITLIISRERKPEIVGWFCDRDSMSTWCDGFLWFCAYEQILILSNGLGIPKPDRMPTIATPDRSNEKEVMWYDDYIRSADWLAGTFAAWDYKTNLVPDHHTKYLQMVEGVVADSTNMVVLPVTLDPNDGALSVTRLTTSKTPPPS